MKKVLVIYFTQTGQLQRAAAATLSSLEKDTGISLTFAKVEPEIPFPYPWSYMEFFDAFPETVKGTPCKMKPYSFDTDENYDLIVIAYQPWFLSVSRPVDSFLQSEEAARLLKGKPVVTILACRNMWLNAQEKMKTHLKRVGANLVGNITYVDRSGNLTSLITVLAFALGGVQDKFLGIFPKYGVSEEELAEKGWKFGDIILQRIKRNDFAGMQKELVDTGAINIKPNLVIMEGRGRVLFPLYADFILKKGNANSRQRRTRVRIFGIVLPIAIFLLSPLIFIISKISPLLMPAKMRRETDYYSGTSLR